MMVWLILACAGKEEDSASTFCQHDPPLSYANFGKGYIDFHCIGCHSKDLPEGHRVGSPLGVDFNTYDDVLNWAERIEARATRKHSEQVTMPPGGGPTSSELDMLETWLECAVFPQKASRIQGEESP